MRSEVVKLRREGELNVYTDRGDKRINSVLLSDLVGELIPVGETKSVRISAEIVEEKGEENVGSKFKLVKFSDHSAFEVGGPVVNGGEACITPSIFDQVVAGWKTGESKVVKSILFDTPSGVPEVTFIETARERLKRIAEDASMKGNAVDAFGLLMAGVQDYLAATEEAEKKGGG